MSYVIDYVINYTICFLREICDNRPTGRPEAINLAEGYSLGILRYAQDDTLNHVPTKIYHYQQNPQKHRYC